MSKWATRLKDIQPKTEISEQCLNSALTITDKTPDKVVSSVIVSGQFRDSLKNNAFESENNRFRKIEQSLKQELTKADETRNDAILSRINRLISEGVKFEILADSFEAFGLSNTESFKFDDQRKEVLCALQQMYLQKHLFDHSSELLEAFKTEIHERSAIVTDGGSEVVFQAVSEVCAQWIEGAIEHYENGSV